MANIIDKINQIRQAVFGKDVRENIASSIESINSEVVSTTANQDLLQTTFNGLVINAGSSNAEIAAGHTSQVTGKLYDTLGHRIDDHDSQLAANSQQLKDIGINIRQFGGHTADEVGFSNFDNHDAILNAIHSLDSVGGGNLMLPSGIIQTTPVDLTGCKNVKIIGNGSNPSNQLYQADINTTIKFINAVVAPLGIKSADSTNPYLATPTYLVHSITVENLVLDGNNKVNSAINGNYNFVMKNVIVKNCISHGIVIEDYGYPVHFRNVLSYFNGGHGLYIRGAMTTCLDFDACEFNFNSGYGLFIEGGASVTFNSCKTQGNIQGGVKIHWNGLGLSNYFLSNLLFLNHYTEANGTLLVGDSKYEGNYALLIDGTGALGNMSQKPTNITFIGGALNQSVNGRALKVNSVAGLNMGATIRSDMIDIATTEVFGIEFSTKPTIASVPSVGTSRALTSYHRHNGCVGKHFNGGLFPARGRTQQLFFYVTTGDLVAGGSCNAKMSLTIPAISATLGVNGYPVMKKGCVYGMQVRKITKTNSSGIISIYPTTGIDLGYSSNLATTGFPLGLLTGTSAIMDMNLSNVTSQNIDYAIDDFPIDTNQILGVRLVAPANYIKGDQDGYIITLLIEY
jgi:hypothetical protein